ncbi:MAG: peptidoglycan DD-metalloendopeptidase family protein [Fibrobacter sp.]|nr:peptidoglycan DD-metalloendopeptidase family protein [Fibrobacter sp.]
MAISFTSAPVYAKAATAKKSDKETSAQSPKSKSDSKKSSKKSKKAKPKKSKKVKLSEDDPKAFTKALLYDKQGVEYEIVESKKKKQNKKDSPQKKEEVEEVNTFDFSTILPPITHEALIGSPYGIRSHRLHRGVDVNVIKDEPVVAAYPGEVTMSRYNKGGYGHYVLIKHPNGIETLYAHLSKRLLNVGDKVFPGDIVGLAGNSGRSSAAHLHFEIRYGEINIDPATVIDFPHWSLKPGVSKFSMKKARSEHRKIQSKLINNNYYVVQAGDSQGDVANWFNISIESLCRINDLKPGAPLKVGQKLRGSK